MVMPPYPLHKWLFFWEKEVDLSQLNWINFYILFCSYILVWKYYLRIYGGCFFLYCIVWILIGACLYLIFRARPVRINFLLNGIIQRRKFSERKWRWVFIYIPRSCHSYLYLIVHLHQQDFNLNLFYNNCRIG